MFLNRSVSNRNILDLIAALLFALLPFLNLASLNPLLFTCGLLGLAGVSIPLWLAFYTERMTRENLVADQPIPRRSRPSLALRWLREGLQSELGEAPGAYWLFAL
ncbi:MAG: hypothetical protein HYR71_00105, partial [Chloroflexi bacterium]|nr:hypothetical protein [Chloroflexota bacterium]